RYAHAVWMMRHDPPPSEGIGVSSTPTVDGTPPPDVPTYGGVWSTRRRDRVGTAGWAAAAAAQKRRRLQIAPRHRAQSHRLGVGLLVDAQPERHVTERAAGLGRHLDDLGALVVPDEGVQRGGRRQRHLGRAAQTFLVGLDAVVALLGEDPRRVAQQLDR